MTLEKPPKIPKDLKLEMGTEDERNWTQVRDSAKVAVKNAEFTIKLQRAVILVCAKKILEERRRFKHK